MYYGQARAWQRAWQSSVGLPWTEKIRGLPNSGCAQNAQLQLNWWFTSSKDYVKTGWETNQNRPPQFETSFPNEEGRVTTLESTNLLILLLYRYSYCLEISNSYAKTCHIGFIYQVVTTFIHVLIRIGLYGQMKSSLQKHMALEGDTGYHRIIET